MPPESLPEPLSEPWMRGPIEGVDARVAPLLYALQHAREDLAHYTEGLSLEQIWMRAGDIGPVGFQIAHIAGSVERLMAYLQGKQLSAEQLAAMKTEGEPGVTREELLRRADEVFRNAEAIVRTLDPAMLSEPREVGRKRLPTTVAGLLAHIGEHTLRHVGEVIITVKVVRTTPLATRAGGQESQ